MKGIVTLNHALRFLLEILLLIIFANWGWNQFEGALKYLAGIGLPLVAATFWGVFRVEGDPGKAPVVIPGWLRLCYELMLFSIASFMLYQTKPMHWALLFSIFWVVHYLYNWRRIKWLFHQ
ncbi:MAG: YrdB family protein [Chitinophagaceae bacterium]|nr:YrdB family protein [Chitinophagaceae bacterium]